MTAIEKDEKINNVEFQIMTDSDSCKETKISLCTSNQKTTNF
jgi:uncharacterized protein YuzB (UPF0349 family)